MAIFGSLVGRMGAALADFERHLASVGKAIRAARSDDAETAVGEKKAAAPDGDEQAEVFH